MNIATDFFNPPLPTYDDALLQHMRFLSSDSSGWQESSPNLSQDSWDMLQQTLTMDLMQDSLLYSDQFMTGP